MASSRAYDSSTRRHQQAALQARLAAAAAELHAEHGATGTSYAQIAQRAGVSLPTVYKYFPSRSALIAACTGRVAAQAPPLPVERIFSAADLRQAAEALVDATAQLHAHYEPWLAWREHRVVPELATLQQRQRRELTALLRQVLSRHLGAAEAARCAPVWETLLDFEPWHRLRRDHRFAAPRARAVLVRLLLAAAEPPPPSSPQGNQARS